MKKLTQFFVVLMALATTNAFSEENIGAQRKGKPANNLAAGCVKSTNSKNLDLNNVRCPILMNGDMWWDAVNNIGRYEIPKGSGKTSLFAGAIWIGGHDQGGNLKVAAQTYRQSGVDFWPGPLDITSVSTNPSECIKYDYHWEILRSAVQTMHNTWALGGDLSKTPADIKNWPGTTLAAANENHFLAPFHDENGDGEYDINDGDYPDFDLSPHPTCGHLYGDQCMWWVFNDEGNIHTETGGAPIGLEIRAQAFDFATNDEINNMTFYNYQIINRSRSTVEETWFGAWVDPDLGYPFDDYVGCDVGRGLGYCYNGEAFDPGTFGYGFNPPAVGVDFFQGPKADSADGIDNNRNGIIDEIGEEIIMSQFVYYNNDFTVIGNPITSADYYNYMRGIWRDGTPITFGGNGHGGTLQTNFMFPGTTDPTNWGTGLGKNNGPAPPISDWTEGEANDIPGDRRFLQSAGKFTLIPGAVNYITTGVVWARATSGGPFASVALLQLADDKAQALFDNCFAITNGPDAPDMTIRELNNELILSIKPNKFSNDSAETNYIEKEPFIHHSIDTVYHFQGYQIFQLKDNSVSITDIRNPDKARLVAQCDIKDNVTQIVNQVFDGSVSAFTPIDEVDGANTGIQHTFDIKTDAFASGTNTKLVNHQTYYFTVIAYAFNSAEVNFDPYHPADGHSTPYLAGRRNIFTYTAIPHIPDPQDGGLLLNSQYGDGPMVQRLEGTGNGGLVLDMTQQSINEALSGANNYRVNTPFYQPNGGPISVQIYDPVKVGNHDFQVYLRDTTSNSKWYITEVATGQMDSSDQTIGTGGGSEKIFPQWGIKVNVQQVKMVGDSAGDAGVSNSGFLEATMSDNKWLTGVPSMTSFLPQTWLSRPATHVDTFADAAKVFETVLGGTWGPFSYGSRNATGPVYTDFQTSQASDLTTLASVDLVFTNDKTKWSRSIVIEEDSLAALADGGARKGDPRQHKSVDKNGNTVDSGGFSNPSDPDASDYISATGMGWFPGYAVNLETGERLNIMFGEDSYLKTENGADMIFNPTSNLYTPFSILDGTLVGGDPLFGGKHYIYIMGHNNLKFSIPVAYDACQALKVKLDAGVTSILPKRYAWKDCMWVGLPLLLQGHSLLETDVRVRLRVAKSYQNYDVGGVYSPLDSGLAAINPKSRGIPFYSFSTAGLDARTDQTTVAKNALDLINIVPNPYYSYSSYERNQLDNRVKIVNLPNVCTVSIYTSSGTLVRRFNRNIPPTTDLTAGIISQAINNSSIISENSIDWDLKNSFNVPIAGGVYIIHVKADGLGERVIKWFGVIRPLDLDTF